MPTTTTDQPYGAVKCTTLVDLARATAGGTCKGVGGIPSSRRSYQFKGEPCGRQKDMLLIVNDRLARSIYIRVLVVAQV